MKFSIGKLIGGKGGLSGLLVPAALGLVTGGVGALAGAGPAVGASSSDIAGNLGASGLGAGITGGAGVQNADPVLNAAGADSGFAMPKASTYAGMKGGTGGNIMKLLGGAGGNNAVMGGLNSMMGMGGGAVASAPSNMLGTMGQAGGDAAGGMNPQTLQMLGALMGGLGGGGSSGGGGKGGGGVPATYKPGTGHVGPSSPFFPGYKPDSGPSTMETMGNTLSGMGDVAQGNQTNAQSQATMAAVLKLLAGNQAAKPNIGPGATGAQPDFMAGTGF